MSESLDGPGHLPDAPEHRFGKFVRVQKLGAGGMGEVWKAWDTELNRWAALKFLHEAEPDLITRFRREARLAAQLTHPNIAAIYEIGDAKGVPFIAMQYIAGKSLSSYPKIAAKTAAAYLRTVAKAVHFAHEQGIIHRDLKPDNLMVDAKGRVYVMDFGLARPTEGRSEISRSGMMLGTPDYMAPEQAKAEKLDPRADVFSLGATLYQMLSGKRPFQGRNLFETLQNVVDAEPALLRQIDPTIPPDLEAIVVKCLEKDRERRYASAADLAQDLSAWLDGGAVQATTISIGARFARKVKRRGALVAISIAAVVGIAGLAAFFLPALKSESQKARLEAGKTQLLEKQRVAMQEVNRLWSRVVTAKEWTRQAFRKPADIRAELEAIERELTTFIAAHPGMPQPLMVRSRARIDLFKLGPAEEDALKATEIEPTFAPGWSLLAKVRIDRYTRLFYGRTQADIEALEKPELERVEAALAKARAVDAVTSWEAWGFTRGTENGVDQVVIDAFRAVRVRRDEPAGREILRAGFARFGAEDICRWIGVLEHEDAERMRWFDQAIAIAPHFPWVYIDRGGERMRTKNREAALADLNCAVEIAPRFALCYVARSHAHAALSHWEEAAQDLAKAIELESPTSEMITELGLLCAKKGDLPGALAHFNKAIGLDPGNMEALNQRGVVRGRLTDFRGAIDDFSQVIKLRPRNADAWNNRGGTWLNMGDPEQAIRDCKQAIAVDGEHADAYVGLAQALAQVNGLEEAMDNVARAMQLRPNDAQVFFTRGMIRCRLGDLAGAEKDHLKSIELDPKAAQTYYHLAVVYAQGGDFTKGIAMCTKSVELDPTSSAAWYNRGLMKKSTGDADGALVDFTKSIQLDPKDVNAWLSRGEIRFSRGEPREALEDLNHAIALDGRNWLAIANRASVRIMLEDFEGAIEDLEKVLTESPGNSNRPKWVERLKTARQRLGK